jgi:hypothetical protein
VDAIQDADGIRIGALAKAAGLTVRTLHHYDAIGLLVPDERAGGGRRLYSPANVGRLERTLAGMLDSLAREPEPTLDQLIQAIEEMKMIDRYYTEDQQEQLRRRREELGEAGIASAERDWADLIAAVAAERDAGTDPTAAPMLELARRWRGLIEQFTGGDEGIGASLSAMYRDQGAQTASRGMVDAELMAYVGRAFGALDRDAEPPADPRE